MKTKTVYVCSVCGGEFGNVVDAEKCENAHGRDEAERLADRLHTLLCHADHTESCNYRYETWATYQGLPFSARRRWVELAGAVAGFCVRKRVDLEVAIVLLKAGNSPTSAEKILGDE